jgi:hypothetical protein
MPLRALCIRCPKSLPPDLDVLGTESCTLCFVRVGGQP